MKILEVILKEDEYDQFDRPQDPNMQKVNADTWLHSNPLYRYAELGYKKNGGELSLEEKKMWEGRALKLQDRVLKIYAQLKTVMPPEERSALNGVQVWVPFDGDYSWATANFNDKKISIDVGCFWDLSNDCIAYTIGHEIGHMVWAYGPQKNWLNPKIRKQKVTPEMNRKDEMDADVYGALLAYKLGYDRRKAWDHFTIAMQRQPFRAGDDYPSVAQRKANVEKAIQAQTAPAEPAQAQTPLTPLPPQAQQPEPEKPNNDMAEKNAWLGHIMNGMQKFEVALADNPTIATA
jgi:hypothetical protein